ncbi:alpha-keto acid decarboxylase family protein [Burkholderia mayonis]|uniref:Indole-3-pyruvate decarboxylase n=1 Tax=Burkholderia mayonis TaxID=1385591 RepID=A0A1B4G2I9_9BURK|nr:thiamine pyrophosphate-dependent enzyme [Burkholderia mayonis]AOJ10139.1 indole-3-pyruvate decarboxylase [Burkholderia mayonis]KVE46961.1 indole-3-pyruvate decarboxylase [Burkholderia mayonis]
MSKTVIQHVLSRLKDLGIKDVFGVAGDYAFRIEDAVCADKEMRWIGSCNELNAAYSADGYARIHGMAALSTTYGVGELSAINGTTGSYAEFLPVFHLVGMPASGVQASRRLVHHTLGNGEFGLFYDMVEPVVCARAIMTPENCIAETERLISAALQMRRPVYMGFPSDHANMPVVGAVESDPDCATHPSTDSVVLNAAVTAIVDVLLPSRTACIVPGILVSRFGLADHALAVVNASNLPFATMFMDKCVLDESHPNYIGMYDGKLMNEEVRVFVEGCDCVIGIGAMPTDFNSGSFTAQIDRSKSINIMPNQVRVGNASYSNVRMEDVLTELAKRITRKEVSAPAVQGLEAPVGNLEGPITAGYLYPRWQQMLRPNDIVIAETGTASMGLAFAHMPKGATFQNQSLWGAIGWATPAAFGAAIATPHRRTILITGEGSHQLTAQEVSQFHRFGLKPIIFVLNNDGYLIERLLCENPESYYNDVAKWNYSKLPEALGCDNWFTARVTTCAELDEAIAVAESCGTGAYVEVVTGRYEASALSVRLHESVDTLYSA